LSCSAHNIHVIPDSFVQELLARVDIVDVVERYVPLRKGGANYSACCPFHSEKTPSFTVSPGKQFYHCFGCGAHGSAIGFVMQYSGVGFVDAIEELAASVGLTVPRTERHRHVQLKKAPLTELMARAMHFYREQLKISPKAVEYLRARGLTGGIAAKFGLGYAPDGWQGLQQVFSDYNDDALVECGLVISNEQGRRYDRFRDRVMFPILDQRSNVIGFGGRVIGDGEPKYLNSPETPLFEKGRELYGLPQARRAIQEHDTVLVVEGYMDVVGLAQHGVEHVVATLGTAATDANVQKLLKLASRVVFCFDRDSAGDRAAWRAMEVSLAHLADNKTVEILQMPGKQDPDEFIREHGKEAFIHHTRNATRLSEFLVRELIKNNPPVTAENRAKLVHEAKPLLQKISAPILRIQIVKEIAARAQLSQAEVEAQCGLKPLARSRYAPAQMKQRPAPSSIEHKLLAIVLHKPTWAAQLPLNLLDEEQPAGAALALIAHAVSQGELAACGLGGMLEFFRGSAHEALVAEMAAASEETPDALALEAVFNDAIAHMQQALLTGEIEQLTAEARHGLNAEQKQRLAELLVKKTRKQRDVDHET
jgi:DNA primase